VSDDAVSYDAVRRRLPRPLQRYLWFFETAIEDAVRDFANALPPGARVLDAGAGEGRYREYFLAARYTGVDLGIGDAAWNYRGLDAIADLTALPFPDGCFEAALNIVTLEHVRDPARVIDELARTLGAGARLLLVVPQDWERHQEPHDYFRYTRHGVRYLLERAGFIGIAVRPGGGYFRLLSRRLLNGAQFFPLPLALVWLLLVGLPALALPALDGLDRTAKFTLGYICLARKPGLRRRSGE
jgi:SAM-dependent methyltransferase